MMYRVYNNGHIEVIAGPMFAGKSTELIRRLDILSYTKKKIIAFKAAIDTRYDQTHIASHSQLKFPAYAVSTAREAAEILKHHPDAETVAFDEVQFFDMDIVLLAHELAMEGKRVICAGLNTDFRGEPFPVMQELMARCEFIEKIASVCAVCASPGTMTQRLVDGKPAKYTDPIVMVGAEESYEPRCRHHHEVPGKPKFEL